MEIIFIILNHEGNDMKKLNIVVWTCIVLSLIILNLINSSAVMADLARPQDRAMHIGACECPGPDGTTSYGFSCSVPGNECYTSFHCFCN